MRNLRLIAAGATACVCLLVGILLWPQHRDVPAVVAIPVPNGSTDASPAVAPASAANQSPAGPAVSANSAPATQPTVSSPVLPRPGSPSIAAAPGANLSPSPPAAPRPPASVQDGLIALDKAQHMITGYHTVMGENPVGTNAEIMRALMGANSRQATFGPTEGLSLNSQGELIDPWGTPYFFHQLSGDLMEIHSAGPDKIMGTPDDLVSK